MKSIGHDTITVQPFKYRRGGKTVKVGRHRRPDKGEKGKTPPSKRWYKGEGSLYGWGKDKSPEARRAAIRRAIKNEGYLPAYNKLMGLANVTADVKTERVARGDINWMERVYKDELSRARKLAR